MANVDELSISIESSAKKANDAIDSVIDRLGKLSNKIKSSLGDIPNIGKNIDISGMTNATKSIQSQIKSAGKSMEQSMKKVSDMTATLSEKYKDLGKGFQLTGSTEYIQKQIDSLSNSLAKAQLRKEELEKSGKIDSQGYEDAVKNVIKLTNQIESLKIQLESINRLQSTPKIKISGREESERLIVEFKRELLDFQNDIKNMGEAYGGMLNIPKGGLDTPIQNLTQSFGELRTAYPQAIDVISAFEQELQRLQGISAQLTKERIVTKVDTSSIDKAEKTIREKIEEIQKLFENSGKDFTFEGNFEQLEKEIQKVNSELEGLYNKQDRMIELGKIDTSQFRDVIRDIENAINRLEILENYKPEALNRTLEENTQKAREATARWNEFREIMNRLEAPRIREDNLEKLNAALQKSENNVENLVTKLNNKILTGEIKANVDDSGFRKLIEQITLAEKESEALSARIAEISKQQLNINASPINAFSSALSKVSAVASSVGKGLNTVASSMAKFASVLQSVLSKIGSFAKTLLGLGKSHKGFNASLGGGIKTLLKYGLGIRSVYILVNKLRSAMKEGFKNLAQYSDKVNDSLSLLKNSMNQTKNALAAAFAPALNALAPIINNLIQLFIRAVNAFNQLTSALLGNGTWIRAKKLTDSYAKSVSGAGKAAKNSIRQFDELKTITTQDSGGADGDTSAEDMFETVDVDADISDFAQQLKEMWEEADFTELGRNIGNKIKDSLESINWDSVFESAKKIGKSLATFLNGLISPELFASVGKTIANALNTAIYATLSFAEWFDWENLGLSIASGINSFFETFNFAELANTLNVWADGIWTTIKTALMGDENGEGGIDWGMIFGKLKDFAFELDVDTKGLLAILVAPTVIDGILKLGKTLFELKKSLMGLGTLFAPLASLFGEGGLLGAGGALAGVSGTVLAVVGAIGTLVAGLGYVYATNEEVRESFSQAVSSIRDGLQPAIEFITQTLLPDLKAGWERLLEVMYPLGAFLQEAFTSIWQDMLNPALTYIGENVLPVVAEAFENLWNNILVPLGTFIADVLEPVISIIADALSILWKNVVVPLAGAIGNILGKALDGFVDILNYVVEKIQPVIEIMQFLWQNVLSPIVSYLKDTLKPVFETVFQAIGGIIDGLGTALGGLIDFVVGVFTGDWEKAWEGVKDIFKGIFNGLISIVEGVVNLIIKGINKFLESFDGITTTLGDIIGIDISIPKIPEVSLARYETGGFPSKYSLFMAGENGIPELAGTVGGRTAVAGGAEITGIKEAINYSHQEEMQLMREQNQLLRGILEKEFGISERQIGQAAANYSRDYMNRTGRSAYSY